MHVASPVISETSPGKIFARYAMAVVFVSASILLRFALIRYFGVQLPLFIVCSPAIVLVALLAGLGPGLLATVLGMLGTDYFLMAPVGSLAVRDRSEAFALVLFGATGVFMSLVAELYRRSQRLISAHKEEQVLRRSEEELRKATEYRQLAFDAAGMGLWEFRTDSGTYQGDENCRKLWGRQDEFLASETLENFIHPDDRAMVRGLFDQAMGGDEKVLWGPEFCVIWPDGSIHWIATYGQSDAKGERGTDRFVGVSVDVTRRKVAEEALRKSEQEYRLLFEQIPDGIFITDLQGLFAEVNSAGVELMGYTRDELCGMAIPEIVAGEEVERLPGVVASLAAGDVVRFEMRHKRKGGSIFEGSVTGRQMPDGRVVAIVRDITQQKQDESNKKKLIDAVQQERDTLSVLIGAMSDEVWFIDTDKKLTLMNLAASTFDFNLGPKADIEKLTKRVEFRRPDGSLRPLDESPPLRALRGEVIRNEREMVRYLETGELRHRELNAAPLRDASGTIIGSVMVVHDVTKRTNAEARIEQLNRVYSVLSEINGTIVRVKDSHAMMEAACRIAVEDGRFRMAWIGMLDSETQTLRPIASSGFVEGYLDRVKIDVLAPNPAGGPAEHCVRSGEHAICNDIEHELLRPWKDDALKNGYRSVGVFPLRREGEVVGVFSLYASETAFFDEAETRLLDELAEDISFALEVNRIEEDRKKKGKELERLNRVYGLLSNLNRIIIREKDSAAVLQTACRIAVETGQFQMAWIGMVDQASQQFRPVTSWGDVGGYLNNFSLDLLDERHSSGPAVQCLLSGQHRVCNDIEGDPAYLPWREKALQHGYRSSAGMPLFVDGRTVGVLNLYAREPGFFIGDELALLDEMAMDISFALEVNRSEEDRKKKEEELQWRTLFFEAQVESSLDGVLVVNSQGKKILQNRRLNELLKIPADIYESPEDAQQRKFVASLMKNPDQFEEKVRYLYSHPDEVSLDELQLIDGTSLERYSSPVTDKSGKQYGRIWTFRDITGRLRLEEQFRQAQKMEAVGQLTGGIAHDFNNLLGVIIGNLDLLERQIKDNEAAVKRVRTARNASLRGADLTRRLLGFARQQDLKPDALDLNTVIETVLALAAPSLGPTIQVITQLAPSIPKVFADASGLENALLNLFVNARDAMAKGGKLTVSSELRTIDDSEFLGKANELTPGCYALVTVSDTGDGMTKETAQKVFEPFFTTKPSGTGLGLAMVYGFFKQSGGTVRIYSEPGSGTTMSFYLPLAEKTLTPASSVPVTETISPGARSGTILIVDDEADLREIASICLSEYGYTVLTAADGESAGRILKEHNEINLLLTDIVMPGSENGVELALRAIKINPRIRIIYCSGFQADALAEINISLAEGPLLRKPYRRAELLAVVREVLATAIAAPEDGNSASNAAS